MNLPSRFFTSAPVKAIITFAAIFYFVLLFYIFFLARRRRGPALPWGERYLNLIPLKEKYDYFVHEPGTPHLQPREFYIDLFGNILLFIPFAFCFYFFFKIKEARKNILISIIISVSIELTQFLLSIGVADIDDVILNTIGATIGVFLLKLLIKVKIFKKNIQRF
jgi:glycopeptide antibiotics resistance protein